MEPVFTINSWALTAIILFVTLLPGQGNAVEYKKVGDEVVLSPGSEASPITSITWKHNSNLAVEWYGGDTIDFYSKFKGRCELNTGNGKLTIPNPTREYSGSYTAEINNRVLNPTEFKFISGVPTPTVSKNCDAEKTHCVLTCEGITTDSEPVTYTWWSGDVTKSQTNQLIITKDDTEPSFICELENPVSSERSREVLNPFIPPPTPIPDNDNSNRNWLIPVLFLFLVAVGVIAGVFIYKHKAGRYPPPLSLLPWFKNNGAGNQGRTHQTQNNADSTGSNKYPENKPLLHDNNGGVQSSFSLDHINETEPLDPPAKPPRRTSLSDPSDQPETTGDDKTDHGKQGTNPPEQNNDESKPENPSAKTGEEESSADSQSRASHLNASDQSGGNEESNQIQKNDDSTGSNKDPDTKSETEEEQETAAEQQQSGSPSVVSDQSDTKSEIEENQEYQGPPPNQQQSGSPSGTSGQHGKQGTNQQDQNNKEAKPGGNGESNQTQKNDDSKGSNKDPEPEVNNGEVQPSSSSPGTVNETGQQEASQQHQNNDESKAENKPLLHDNNGEVQVLTTLDHINETVDASKESEDDRTPPHPDPSAGLPRHTSLSGPRDKPEGEIKSDKDEARDKPAETSSKDGAAPTDAPPPPPSEEDATQNKDVSTENNKDPEKEPLLHGNKQRVQASSSDPGTVNETDLPAGLPRFISLPDLSDQPDTTSETKEKQAATAERQQFGSSSGTSDHSELKLNKQRVQASSSPRIVNKTEFFSKNSKDRKAPVEHPQSSGSFSRPRDHPDGGGKHDQC